VRLGRVSELGPAECWFVGLAGLAFAGTKQVWLMNVSLGVAPALPAKSSWGEPGAREASPPIPEGRLAATTRPACVSDSPYNFIIGGAISHSK
jgi:hypothetical protein